MATSTHLELESADPDELVLTVVDAVSSELGVAQTGLDQTVYDVLDPDALAGLFDGRGDVEPAFVQFGLSGCTVTITRSGGVTATREHPTVRGESTSD